MKILDECEPFCIHSLLVYIDRCDHVLVKRNVIIHNCLFRKSCLNA